ncbi:MAG: Txe/YoeB family addiction module toxin [Desulfamplus sp.]|nr:Txe/YoeB family addiction module toxin [Desulfamplus sp.]
MIYKVLIHKNAHDDLSWFRKNDKTSYIKLFDMIREITITPRDGTGKPERLKYFDKEVYSRRVNHKDRIVYTIYEELNEIDITSCRGHYS